MIAYLLGLYYLNNIMLYLSPAEDPENMEFRANEDDGLDFVLPQREQDEYKGFARKIHEMELWKEMIKSTTIAAFFSCF